MGVGAERLRYASSLDPNEIMQNIDVSGILPVSEGMVVMCVEDSATGGIYHTYHLNAFGYPFAIPENIRGRYPVSFRLIKRVIPSSGYGPDRITRAATTLVLSASGLPLSGLLSKTARGVFDRAARRESELPQTLFENLLLGFPFRGCPIELGGLR